MVSPGSGYSSSVAATATATVKVESPVSIQMTRTPSDGSMTEVLSPRQSATSGATTKEELLRLLVSV